MKGKVYSINISAKKGTPKAGVNAALLKDGFGIEGDIHAGGNDRQVSLLPIERIRQQGLKPGDFAENITTSDLNFSKLNVGDRLVISDNVLLEISLIGKKCHSQCGISKKIGSCIMPKEGIFTRVLHGGKIKIGDSIEVIPIRYPLNAIR